MINYLGGASQAKVKLYRVGITPGTWQSLAPVELVCSFKC